MSDSLLSRVASGDTAAVRECFDRYGGLVWSLARRFTDNAAEAEDAVQEIFIDLWKSAARFDENVAAEPTFVSMIARRRLIDRRRKQQRRPDTEPLPERAPEDAPSTVARAEIADEASRARDAMNQLRPEQRNVLELAVVQGLTHAEIAEKTDMPLGTVKTHARRGLIRVRELLSRAKPDRAGGPR